MELSVDVSDPLSPLKGSNGQQVLILLVHGNAVVKEGQPAARVVILLQHPLALDRQAVPVSLT